MTGRKIKNKPMAMAISKTKRGLRRSSLAMYTKLHSSSLPQRRLLLSDIGITPVEALELRLRLKPFEEDWNAPGMEAYDEL